MNPIPPGGARRGRRSRPAGDRSHAELERFVAEASGPLLRAAYLMAWDLAEAEDLVQECLLKVSRRWSRVSTMEHPYAYARRILLNLALDDGRKRTRRRQELAGAGVAAEAPELPDEAAARALLAVDVRSELLAALAALPARQRAVIVLRFYEDLPEAQVAEALGCSLGTVKSTASRGLERLQQAFDSPRPPGGPPPARPPGVLATPAPISSVEGALTHD